MRLLGPELEERSLLDGSELVVLVLACCSCSCAAISPPRVFKLQEPRRIELDLPESPAAPPPLHRRRSDEKKHKS